MDNIIDKLNKIEDNNCWEKWTLEEKKKLLDLYLNQRRIQSAQRIYILLGS
jgi:hypothetical protein